MRGAASDDVILAKLRRSLPGNTPPGELRGNWMTGAESVRLLELIGHRHGRDFAVPDPRPAAPAPTTCRYCSAALAAAGVSA